MGRSAPRRSAHQVQWCPAGRASAGHRGRRRRESADQGIQTQGAWLRWLERSLHTAEVTGSSPVAPTTSSLLRPCFSAARLSLRKPLSADCPRDHFSTSSSAAGGDPPGTGSCGRRCRPAQALGDEGLEPSRRAPSRAREEVARAVQGEARRGVAGPPGDLEVLAPEATHSTTAEWRISCGRSGAGRARRARSRDATAPGWHAKRSAFGGGEDEALRIGGG
jgi:hypothetical protein